jgi:GT2 family glycosyltransferase
MQAIVICTIGNPGITILLESIKVYAPELPIYLCSNNLSLWGTIRSRMSELNVIYRPNPATNFGDAYNAGIDYAFSRGHDSLIVANDDVVITPSTIDLLKEDAEILESNGVNLGFLGARSDYVLPDQNIRFPVEEDERVGLKWESEFYIKPTGVIAPIFATISKKAWDVAKFPSTNWYSDNIICHDLQKAGFEHFVSRAYVHHAGSQTVGTDFEKCHEEPREWIKANRPDIYEGIYGA